MEWNLNAGGASFPTPLLSEMSRVHVIASFALDSCKEECLWQQCISIVRAFEDMLPMQHWPAYALKHLSHLHKQTTSKRPRLSGICKGWRCVWFFPHFCFVVFCFGRTGPESFLLARLEVQCGGGGACVKGGGSPELWSPSPATKFLAGSRPD